MKLHGYQETAVAFLRGRNRACLFLDMGLGKTAIVLSALEPRHLPALVIAPKRVTEEVWPVEVPKWRPDLKVSRVVGSPAKRATALRADADIYVISRDNIGDLVAAKTLPYKTIVIDELSGFKSHTSLRFKNAKKIKNRCVALENVFGLSGTPTPNGYLDLWSQMLLVDAGERLGTSIGGYRSRYFVPDLVLANHVVASWKIRPMAEENIKGLIEDICLSMDVDLDLPPIIHNTVTIELPPEARRIYRDLAKDLVASIDILGKVGAANHAVLSSKLSQVAAGFIFDDDHHPSWLHDVRVNAVKEVVEGTGSPCIVLYRYIPERDRLQAILPGVRLLADPGVIADWNAGKVPVLLAHAASIGHGLNLQEGGHTMIWSSLPWSLEEWQQTNKRLPRQGQKNTVVIHSILARNSIDQVIESRLAGKANIQDDLLAHLESPL